MPLGSSSDAPVIRPGPSERQNPLGGAVGSTERAAPPAFATRTFAGGAFAGRAFAGRALVRFPVRFMSLVLLRGSDGSRHDRR